MRELLELFRPLPDCNGCRYSPARWDTFTRSEQILSVLNIAFFVVHNLLMLFNMTGWIWPRTRRLHLVAIGATLFSWIVMGAWRGWGYCLCTDYHFKIRRELGIHQGESSYTQLLLNQLPGVSASRQFADTLTVSILVLIFIATVVVWIRRPLSSHEISAKICKNEDENAAEPS